MSSFIFTETGLPGVFVVETSRFRDERGSFQETYREPDFVKAGLTYHFVQDNLSSSRRGVLRGLHFQKRHPQAKLVRVQRGEVFDVAVDLRKASAFYGRWVGVLLSESNGRQLMIPRGFAHGFLVLSERADLAYKCDELYHPEDEGGILWNDPDIAIRWPEHSGLILSEKDRGNPTLAASGIVF